MYGNIVYKWIYDNLPGAVKVTLFQKLPGGHVVFFSDGSKRVYCYDVLNQKVIECKNLMVKPA